MVFTGQEGGDRQSGDVSPTYANMDIIQDLLKGYSSEEYLLQQEGEVLAMQSQYRDPPPYPGHSKQMNPAGVQQSFSGSETSTDVSVSSTENLSTSQRQEPQGEENQTPHVHHNSEVSDTGGFSILERLAKEKQQHQHQHQQKQQQQQQNMGYFGSVPHPTDHTGYLNSAVNGPQYSWGQSNQLAPPGHRPSIKCSDSSAYSSREEIASYNLPVYTSNSQWSSEQLSHCGSNEHVHNSGSATSLQSAYFTNLPPPPQYPGAHGLYENSDRTKMRRSYETVDNVEIKSCHSQPDLSRYWEAHNKFLLSQQATPGSTSPHSQHTDDQSPPITMKVDDINFLTIRATKMVDLLTEENKRLREEVNLYSKRLFKLQKFEIEIQKVHEAYESLVQSSQKRERLEQMRKSRLEEEIKKLQTQNKLLTDRLESKSPGSSSAVAASSGDSMVELLAKNKELLCDKEKLEKELLTLRSTLQSNNEKIEILAGALTNAQANVVSLEEERCVKQVQMERLDQLQKAFTSLQAACEKREQMEKQLRTKLEKELEILKSQKSGAIPQIVTDSGKESPSELTNLYSLQRLLNEKEAKILQLEAEVVKWEQKYLEENMRQLALQNPEIQDHCLFDSDRLTDGHRMERLGPMEEMYQAQISELEAKVKCIQTELAEKEAMIRVFQRSPMTRSSSVHTLNYCTPMHSPRPSLITSSSTLTRQGSQSDSSSFRDFPSIKHIKTGSTSALEMQSNSSTLQNKEEGCSDDEDTPTGDKVWQV